MQKIQSEKDKFVFNLARGEELFETMLRWCKEEGVTGGTLTGLGAADQLELAYYNLDTKEYERHLLDEAVEILSLTGNVAMIEDEPALHIHGVFGRKDLTTFGGHLFKLRVSGACEVHVVTFDGAFMRSRDEATGLNLLCGVSI